MLDKDAGIWNGGLSCWKLEWCIRIFGNGMLGRDAWKRNGGKDAR